MEGVPNVKCEDRLRELMMAAVWVLPFLYGDDPLNPDDAACRGCGRELLHDDDCPVERLHAAIARCGVKTTGAGK